MNGHVGEMTDIVAEVCLTPRSSTTSPSSCIRSHARIACRRTHKQVEAKLAALNARLPDLEGKANSIVASAFKSVHS